MNQYMRVKPVLATFYPQEVRNQSGQQKENRFSVVAGQSRFEEKPQSVDKLKSQIIQLQGQQNDLNENLQIQIRTLMERMNNAESHIARIYECGWMEAVNFVQEDMHRLQEQLSSVQNIIMAEEEKSQHIYSEQINQMKCTVLDQIGNMESEMNSKIEQLRNELNQSNMVFHQKLAESNDIEKYQKFNEEMSLYFQDHEEVAISPRYKSRSQKLQLQPISELEETAQQSFQFLQSQSLQYQLDNEGFLLLNGEYIYDSVGKKQQLSSEQIRYLNLLVK